MDKETYTKKPPAVWTFDFTVVGKTAGSYQLRWDYRRIWCVNPCPLGLIFFVCVCEGSVFSV